MTMTFFQSPLLREFTSLLYWAMLAACTIGPGTVVTCSRAGSEYGLSLIWSLVVASILAYILLEGTARLTIVSGMSLGQCLRVKYQNTAKVYNTAVICWMSSISIFLGNTFYELNCWAGGIDAIFAIPGVPQTTEIRVACCVGYAVIVLALLYWDKTDILGVFLGIVLVGMAVLFFIVVVKMDVDWAGLGWGFIPNIPDRRENAAEPTDLIISLVSTTAVGFNLFLGGSMAEGKDLKAAQRGIGFSTIGAFSCSALILVVGSANFNNGSTDQFEIADISQAIVKFFGTAGVIIYAIGFIAAALSSMLTTALGAALTANSMFSTDKEITLGDGTTQSSRTMPRWIYLGIMFSMVIVATIVVSTNVDRKLVILIAQVFNGCLLPFFCICLLLCINDMSLMSQSPQKGWSNVLLAVTVTITLFLTFNVLIQKVSGSFFVVYIKFLLATGLALVTMALLFIFTTLGKDIVRSFRHHCFRSIVIK